MASDPLSSLDRITDDSYNSDDSNHKDEEDVIRKSRINPLINDHSIINQVSNSRKPSNTLINDHSIINQASNSRKPNNSVIETNNKNHLEKDKKDPRSKSNKKDSISDSNHEYSESDSTSEISHNSNIKINTTKNDSIKPRSRDNINRKMSSTSSSSSSSITNKTSNMKSTLSPLSSFANSVSSEKRDSNDGDGEDRNIRRKSKKSTGPCLLLKEAEKMAKKLRKENKFNDCIRKLIECTVYSRLCNGDDSLDTAEYHMKLASGYLELKGMACQAVYHSEISGRILENPKIHISNENQAKKFKQKIEYLRLERFYILARALASQEKFLQAYTKFSLAEKLLKKLTGGVTMEKSQVYQNILRWNADLNIAIAKFYHDQKKYNESLERLKYALTFKTQYLDKDDVQLIPLLQNLGKVEQCRKGNADYSQAMEYYLRAHSIANAKYAENSREIGNSCLSVALGYTNVNLGEAEASAEAYLKEALSIFENLQGDYQKQILEIKEHLSNLFIRTGRIEDNLTLTESTLVEVEQICNYYSKEMARAYKLIGFCSLSLGNLNKAWRNMQKCYEIECVVYTPKHRLSLESFQILSNLRLNPSIASKLENNTETIMKNRPQFALVTKNTNNNNMNRNNNNSKKGKDNIRKHEKESIRVKSDSTVR